MRYEWIAIYEDGRSCLPQFDSTGKEHKYAEIDRDRLRHFVIQDKSTKRVMLVVSVPKGSRLIYRLRHEQWGNGPNDKRSIVLVGCQKNDRGVNSQFVTALFEDGRMEVRDGFDENDRWFHSPKLHPHEGEVWEGIE